MSSASAAPRRSWPSLLVAGALVVALLAAFPVAGAASCAAAAAEAACRSDLDAEDAALGEAPVLLQVSTQLAPLAASTPPAPADARAVPQSGRERWRAAGLCAVAAAGVGIASAALFLHRRRKCGASGRAVAVDLVCVFQENVLFTFTMLDVLDLSTALGKDAAYSGALIGMHKVGTGLGSLLLWLLLLYSPEVWRRGRSAVATGVSLQWVGAISFGLAGILSREGLLTAAAAAPALCLARVVQGVGGGLQLALTSNHIARLVPVGERVSENMNFFLAACLGLGLGPLFASLVKLLAGALPCNHPGLLLDAVLVVNMVLPCVQLVCLLAYPNLGQVEDQHCQAAPEDELAYAEAPMAPARRTIIILCCIAMQVVRNFSVASLEAALTMLLESQYHWSAPWVGPAVALALSGGLWLKLAYDACRDFASSTFWLRLMIGVAIFASLLLVPAPLLGLSTRPSTDGVWEVPRAADLLGVRPEVPLLLGSALLFPALALSSGLVMGTLQEHVFPGKSFLNLNTATLLTLVGADLLGRGLGPPAARSAVEVGGQARFAQQQIVAGLVALLVHEAMVLAAAKPKPAALYGHMAGAGQGLIIAAMQRKR